MELKDEKMMCSGESREDLKVNLQENAAYSGC